MKWIRIIRKLLASIVGIETASSDINIDITNQNYILALSPVDINSNIAGYIIIVMLVAILDADKEGFLRSETVLIGYTLMSNSKK